MNTQATFLSSRNNTHVRFDEELSTPITEEGEYLLLVTPKALGDDDGDDNGDDSRHSKPFTPYRYTVQFGKNSAPSIVSFTLAEHSPEIRLVANLPNRQARDDTLLEVEFLMDGMPLASDDGWRVTAHTDDSPQSFILEKEDGSPLPGDIYSARLRTASPQGQRVPSHWVTTNNLPIDQ